MAKNEIAIGSRMFELKPGNKISDELIRLCDEYTEKTSVAYAKAYRDGITDSEHNGCIIPIQP